MHPPVISLNSLRRTAGERNGVSEHDQILLHDLDQDAWCTVQKIEASLKKFGCVCVPVSDIDVGEGTSVYCAYEPLSANYTHTCYFE